MKRFRAPLVALALLAVSTVASATLYHLFGPVTGILKGSATSPQTSAAVAADVVGLFSTCSGTQYLGADGACHTGAAGSVTSVALSDASTTPIYGVTGSPVTTSGTLTLTLATESANRIFAGPSTGAAAQPTFRALVAADLPGQPLTGTSSSIGGGALAAGACASTTVTVTGATTAMVADSSPVADPGTGNYWQSFVSAANTVTVRICATVAGTPTATTYNVRVIQ